MTPPVSEDELAERARRMAEGAHPYRAVGRSRKVSTALRTYAAFVTSASEGAVRDTSLLDRLEETGAMVAAAPPQGLVTEPAR